MIQTLDSFRLDGRAALVTGAARGLGRAVALALAEAGCDVCLVDILPCGETAAEIERHGRRARSLEMDLRNLSTEAARALVGEGISHLGGLDILVNNAGLIHRAQALEYPAEAWDATLQVNLTSAFLLAQAFARYARESGRRGKIINVASMLSFQGGQRVAAYAAAKSGLAGLTRALANEWAPLGINVNAIAPGYFATEVTAELRADPERAAAILSRIPAGRWGEPDDLKGAAVFLASAASDYVHGAILPVDGGWLAF